MKNTIALIGLFCCILIGCEELEFPYEEGSFTDYRDGRIYKTIIYGNQEWMIENLAFDFGDSDDCWAYNDDETLVPIHGRLYTWQKAKEACPHGWHLPSYEEWLELINFLGKNGYGFERYPDKIAKAMASKSTWITCSGKGIIGKEKYDNNRTGFSAYPSGYREADSFANVYSIEDGTTRKEWVEGFFIGFGSITYWWTSTLDTISSDCGIGIVANVWTLSSSSSTIESFKHGRDHGYSVRCVRNN